MTIVSHDYESRSEVDLRKCGLDRYSADPSTEVVLCAYRIDNNRPRLWDKATGEPFPRELREALEDPHVEKRAFNAQFERVMARRVLKIKTPYRGWRCTMVRAFLNSFTGGLGDVGRQMGLGAEVLKDPEGDRLIRAFSVPQKVSKNQPHRWRDWNTDPAEWQKFGEYCLKDEVAEHTIDRHLERFPIPELEWELYEIDQRINDRGLPIDRKFVEHAIQMSDRRKRELLTQMKDITRLANPGSTAQLLPWLQARGYRFGDLGKDTVKKVLVENDEDMVLDYDAVRVLHLRQHAARMSVKKYDTILNVVGDDDRARFMFQFAGASRTGRWAGRKIQVQNLPHTPKSMEDDEGLLEEATNAVRDGDYDALCGTILEPMNALVGLIRSSVRVRDDETEQLSVSDLSSIESRVLAWLSGCQRKLKVFEEGRDSYKDFGSLLFNKPYEEVTKTERNQSKPADLGCGYRLGGGELKEGKRTGLWGYAEKMGIPMTQLEAHRGVRVWREGHPEVVEFWYALENAISRVLRQRHREVRVGHLTFFYEKPFLSMRLPSDRCVRYYQPRIELEEHISQRTGQTYTKEVFSYMGKSQVTMRWQRIKSHGGRTTEQATQATAREVLKVGMKRAADAGFPLIGSVHDELIGLTRKNDNRFNGASLREFMIEPISWAPGLPLNGSAADFLFYRK